MVTLVEEERETPALIRGSAEVVAGIFTFKREGQITLKFDVPATSIIDAFQIGVYFAGGKIGRAAASYSEEEDGMPIRERHVKIGQVCFETVTMKSGGEGLLFLTTNKEALKASKVKIDDLVELQEKSIKLVVVRKIEMEQ